MESERINHKVIIVIKTLETTHFLVVSAAKTAILMLLKGIPIKYSELFSKIARPSLNMEAKILSNIINSHQIEEI